MSNNIKNHLDIAKIPPKNKELKPPTMMTWTQGSTMSSRPWGVASYDTLSLKVAPYATNHN